MIHIGFFRRGVKLPPKGGSFAHNLRGLFAHFFGVAVGPEVSRPHRARFALSRWFASVAFTAIAAIAAASVWLLSWFVTERMLWQEGALTRDFVHSLMVVEKPLHNYLRNPDGAPPQLVLDAFEHIGRMPDVVRANVYGRNRQVVWSSDPQLIGRNFGVNDDLDAALSGTIVVEKKTDIQRVHGKAEYERLRPAEDLFMELYMPVLDVETGKVIAAIEFYKNPRALMGVLAQLRNYIAFGALVFGLLLFVALFWLVRRADLTMQSQEHQLVEKETFVVVGEMSSVVAHGIRNPLAAIRSSAELILESPGHSAADAARDIVAQSDRLGSWVRELLAYTRPADETPQPVALEPLVRACLKEFSRECERRHIGASAHLTDHLPDVRGDSLAVGQVLRSVLANALDAVPEGGRIIVRASSDLNGRAVTLTVEDNGPGLTPDQRERVGKPFFTTKAHGMGLGLALARRVIERAGGSFRIDSEPGRGTMVSIMLRAA
jgi:two-component system, NtrC family, sensor histidine kinase HydH